jgi:hypothetical protein
MQCTKCNSENTQRLEVVFEHGTQNISTTSHSAGAGIGGSFGIGGVRTSTSGTSQSTLAGKASPPAKKSLKAGVILVIIGLVLLNANSVGMKIFGLFGIAGGGYLIYSAVTYNSNVWPGLYKYWRESWLCNKCGTIYHQP